MKQNQLKAGDRVLIIPTDLTVKLKCYGMFGIFISPFAAGCKIWMPEWKCALFLNEAELTNVGACNEYESW